MGDLPAAGDRVGKLVAGVAQVVESPVQRGVKRPVRRETVQDGARARAACNPVHDLGCVEPAQRRPVALLRQELFRKVVEPQKVDVEQTGPARHELLAQEVGAEKGGGDDRNPVEVRSAARIPYRCFDVVDQSGADGCGPGNARSGHTHPAEGLRLPAGTTSR